MNRLIILLSLLSLIGAHRTYFVSENDIPEINYLNTSFDPCDDFYQYTCGNFKKFHQRDENQKILDLFTMTEKELIRFGNEILSSPIHKRDPEALKKVKMAYKGCLDPDYITAPETELINDFGGLPLVDPNASKTFTWNQIAEIIARTGIQQFFNFAVNNFNPNVYIFIMFADEWTDPATIRGEYTKTYDEILRESFKKTAKRVSPRLSPDSDPLLTLLRKIAENIYIKGIGFPPNDDDLEQVLDFWAQIWRDDDGKTIDGILPLDSAVTLGQLQNWTDLQFDGKLQLNWLDFLNSILKLSGIELDSTTMLYIGVTNVKLFKILNLVQTTDPAVVKNAVLLRTFAFLAPDSDSTTQEAFKEYYLSLNQTVYNRTEYCTRKLIDVADTIGFSLAVAHEYARYHFDGNKIRKTVEMIQNLRDAFVTILSTSDWVDEESRDVIVEKVNNLVLSLSYPDFIENKKRLDSFYENVRICGWDNYGNSQRIRAFKQAYAFTELTERGNFSGTSPFQVNAFAQKANNKVVLPMSLLQDGFFYGTNPIIDYSRLGTTISHEMTHNFDSGGIKYNQDAYQKSRWFSNATYDALQERIQCLKDQYSGYYVPEIEQYVDGTATLNENFADNGGIRKAFLAYQDLIKNKKIRNTSKKYSLEQLFFIGYGTMWCSDESIDWLKNLVTTNEHPPSRVRILGTLSNFDEFSKAFDCPTGSNLNPEKKCVVW